MRSEGALSHASPYLYAPMQTVAQTNTDSDFMLTRIQIQRTSHAPSAAALRIRIAPCCVTSAIAPFTWIACTPPLGDQPRLLPDFFFRGLALHCTQEAQREKEGEE